MGRCVRSPKIGAKLVKKSHTIQWSVHIVQFLNEIPAGGIVACRHDAILGQKSSSVKCVDRNITDSFGVPLG